MLIPKYDVILFFEKSILLNKNNVKDMSSKYKQSLCNFFHSCYYTIKLAVLKKWHP